MKIKKIEFENFRNFKDHGEIRCSTNGKVTIIYGKNGDGKTTLHQLLQWVFYGEVKFNKTTTDRLYNLSYEADCSFGETFEVMGRVDFEHNEKSYCVTRKSQYKKGLDDSAMIGEDFSVLYMTDDHDWKRMDRPQDIIEKLLPSGLSEYFFFDGESMIADLRVKGKDSAGKLRKALYSMFDLDVLELAISHIGSTQLKTTVLGKLYLSKSKAFEGGKVAVHKHNIEEAQNKIASLKEKMDANKSERKEKQEFIQRVSEEIGNTKSKAEYERQRNELKKKRDLYLKNAISYKEDFGNTIVEMFTPLLISKAVADAKKKIHLEIENNYLPPGVGKKLVTYLLKPSTKSCVCGAELSPSAIKRIEAYQAMLPPKSYTSMYNEFTRSAKAWGRGYDRDKVEKYISLVLQNNEYAVECDRRIHDLDKEEKNSKDIEDLIVARQQAEARIDALDEIIADGNTELRKFEIYLKNEMKKYDEATVATEENNKATKKIEIMNQVLEYFETRLEMESKEYSRRLEENIQELLNAMLTSRRNVSVSESFAVRVTDSYDDESKSEGQFAVVSFAYIGGILKMLQSEEGLAGKEYPLVLDGPFSKLDPDQRQNVVNMLPEFAPQVILFSKDSLQDVFSEDRIGNVWTISSNSEKNIAKVEEGYRWK